MRTRWMAAGMLTLVLTGCGRETAEVRFSARQEAGPASPATLLDTAVAVPPVGTEPEPQPQTAEPSPSQGELRAEPLPASPAPAPTSAPPPEPSPSPSGPRELGEDEDAVVGQPYRYRLYTHCGIGTTWFDGRWWDAEPRLDNGHGSPPGAWGDPYQDGVIVLVSEDRLEFTGDEGQRADFVPRPEGSAEPPPCA